MIKWRAPNTKTWMMCNGKTKQRERVVVKQMRKMGSRGRAPCLCYDHSPKLELCTGRASQEVAGTERGSTAAHGLALEGVIFAGE